MRSRRVWGTAAVAAVGVSGVLVFQGFTGGASGGDDATGKPGPVRSEVRKTALRVSADGRRATLDQRDTEPFSMLGVTWTDPAAKVAGTIEARVRAAKTDAWSGWKSLAVSDELASAEGTRGGRGRGTTDPVWVGPSNGVEIRVVAGGKASGRLPSGLRLDMVDPGRPGAGSDADPVAYDSADPSASPTPTDLASPGDSAPPTTEPPSQTPSTEPAPSSSAPDTPSASPSVTQSQSPSGSASPTVTVPPAPPSTAPRPPIVSRAEWGADESLNNEAPEYLTGGIKTVFVQHTNSGNDYTCVETPAVLRALRAYHMNSMGMKDLGYNFVVDKCGAIYEGRKGGVDQPVLGAHTYGFNRESTGIAILGTYNTVQATDVALTGVARISAYKLGQYGGDPAGTTSLTAGATQTNYFRKSFIAGQQYTFQRIGGHRDGYNTLCPGSALYAQLPTIRSLAAGPVTGLTLTSLSGAGRSGSTYYTMGTVTANWSAATPSSLISKFELLVDGKVAATASGATYSAKTILASGTHTVEVRAVHQSGRTTTTPAVTVIAETTAPSFTTKPKPSLRTGTVDTAAVPLTLGWKATDNAALKEVRLTSPTAKTYGPTTTSAALTAKSGVATTWNMTAYDQAGNTAAASVSGTPVILQESSATKSGAWTTKSSSSYLGGKSYSSSSKNAAMTWTFTGRSVSWVVSRAATSGQAYVYLDGTKVATLDLKSSTTQYRQAVFTKTWSSSAKHTLKIVVAGTSGRPTVTTDGIAYLK